ncbi:MAG: iron-containing alcohol dehydrogenase [Tissierellia bacterium]|nr:iron-containing alcohol dehydrogenase [Tissierellia bacterium]
MNFYLPTRIYCGDQSVNHLMDLTQERIMICADPFLKENAILQNIIEKLEGTGKKVTFYTEIVPDAPLSKIEAMVQVVKEKKAQVLVAIGGGSALDATKSSRFFYEKIYGVHLPLIAIPTTSGTGSEVTDYVVIKDHENGKKTPLFDPAIFPDVAILDPGCVTTMPSSVARDTGLDVLTHALEAYVSKESNIFTKTYAYKAIALVFENLKKSVLEKDPEAQVNMHYASTMAGIAFGQSGLGINHSLAHAMGGRYGLPHGRANGILLPYVLAFHGSRKEGIYDEICQGLGLSGFSADRRLKNFIKDLVQLRKDLDLPDSFREAGLDQEAFYEDLDDLVNLALKDPCTGSSPLAVDQKDLRELLETAYLGHPKKRVYGSSVLANPSF